MGDVREAPPLSNGFAPWVGIWARADDGGMVVGVIETGADGVAALVEALLGAPGPQRGESTRVFLPGDEGPWDASVLPGRAAIVDPALVYKIQPRLARAGIQVVLQPPSRRFDALFEEVFDLVEAELGSLLFLPDALLRQLCNIARRLWLAAPWAYTPEAPPISLRPGDDRSATLHASVMGKDGEAKGVTLYASLADYVRSAKTADRLRAAGGDREAAAAVLADAFHERAFLLTYESRASISPGYAEQVVRAGWPADWAVVPVFVSHGAGSPVDNVDDAEATVLVPALAALLAFCERNRDAIVAARYPIEEMLDPAREGLPTTIAVRMPSTGLPLAPKKAH